MLSTLPSFIPEPKNRPRATVAAKHSCIEAQKSSSKVKKGAMARTLSQIPTSFGHELRACFRFHLVKTYDQVN
ncbi:hypothetical protein GQ457_08G020510 [Hibiscus cannabinus]